MIKSLSQLLPAIAQEGNAMPGEGLSVTETVTRYFLIPFGIFVVLGGLAWISGRTKTARADKRNVVTSID